MTVTSPKPKVDIREIPNPRLEVILWIHNCTYDIYKIKFLKKWIKEKQINDPLQKNPKQNKKNNNNNKPNKQTKNYVVHVHETKDDNSDWISRGLPFSQVKGFWPLWEAMLIRNPWLGKMGIPEWIILVSLQSDINKKLTNVSYQKKEVLNICST